MYLPPDQVPKRNLMTPRIPRIDIFVLLIHAWYRQSSCLSVFLQFRIFLGLFLLKTRKFDVFTPGFGPKGGLNDPQNLQDRYFCIAKTCMVHAEQSLISIFTIQNFFGPTSPKKNVNLMYLPPDLVPKGDLVTPRISGMDIFVFLKHVWYTQSCCLSVFLQFRIFLDLFLLKTRKFDVFTPGFGPKGGLNGPYQPVGGYFGIDITCMVYAEQLLISIFTIQNFSGPISPKTP